jgi:hypothetical protein
MIALEAAVARYSRPASDPRTPVLDLLDSIPDQLRARLDELRPTVSEYERLPRPHKHYGQTGRRPPHRLRQAALIARERRRARTARTPTTSAKPTTNRAELPTLIGERPGITKAEQRGCGARRILVLVRGSRISC